LNKSKDEKSLTKGKSKFTDEEIKAAYSSLSLVPSNAAAKAIASLNSKTNLGDTGIAGLDEKTIRKMLQAENGSLIAGDMSRAECMLLDQAHTLQMLMTLFTVQLIDVKHLDHLETYSRIALKAQNQCRQTIATLGELKNPKRVNFIRQQNNAVNQQINQGGLKQAQNSKKPDNSANKLLDEVEHERMDIGSSQEAVRGYQKVEALGAVNRAENKDRKGQG